MTTSVRRRRASVRVLAFALLLGFFAVYGVLFLPPADASTTALKVMPLGDSITEGQHNDPASHDGGYRYVLSSYLDTAYPQRVDFVGSLTVNSSGMSDPQHEGHAGWRTDQIDAQVADWMTAYQPDVLLLHIGTNDVLQGYDASHMLTHLRQILTKIYAARPGATVILATLVPVWGPPGTWTSPAWTTYNAALPAVVRDFAAAGGAITLADMHTGGLSSDSRDLPDGTHPNASGYAKMAAVFKPLLARVLASTSTPSATPTVPPAVEPAVDTTPPAVSLTAPRSGASVTAGSTVTLTATASDDRSVASVAFTVDGRAVFVDTRPPYRYTTSSIGARVGTHSVSATATDAGGNRRSTPAVTVTVRPRPPAFAGTVDDATTSGAQRFGYTGSWVRCRSCTVGAARLSYRYSVAAGSTVTVTFSGRKAVIRGVRDSAGGTATVLVDGRARGTASFAASKRSLGAVYTTPVLSSGTHRVTLIATGPKPGGPARRVSVDKASLYR